MNPSSPIIDGCYLNHDSSMIKVRMVSYAGDSIKEVVVEDTFGNIKSMDFYNWQTLKLIPCCYVGKESLVSSPASMS